MKQKLINKLKIAKAAKWMDLGDRFGAKAILREVIRDCSPEEEPFTLCEAFAFLGHILTDEGDATSGKRFFIKALSINNDMLLDMQSDIRLTMEDLGIPLK